MNAKQLNRTIAAALRACKSDETGRAKRALVRLNHARRLYAAGYEGAAVSACVVAAVELRAARAARFSAARFALSLI